MDEIEEAPILPEYSDVKLVKDYKRDELSLPAGAIGTIVDIYPDFKSYTVEFFDPIRVVETVAMTLVTPV
jgi:hypothetical protein